MTEEILERARNHFAGLGPVETEFDPNLKMIEVDGGRMTLDIFHTEKIEKLIFSSIELFETGVVESTVMAWPDDNYCFPLLWCNLTIVPEVMNVPICDFIPLVDIVVWPEYREKYITDLSETRASALEALEDTVIDKAVDVPSESVCAFSPYKLVATITDQGVALVPDMMDAYFASYVELVERDQPVKDGDERNFYLNKKRATRTLMKQNDPGYPFMIDVFGEELTEKVFDLIF